MDALFGHELRNEHGRLLHVKRGTYGIDLVLQYFDDAASKGSLNWDLAAIKADRLINEFQTEEQANAAQAQPAQMKKPSAKSKFRKTTVEHASDDEGDYAPPKTARKEPRSPSRVFEGNGDEEEELTEAGAELVCKPVSK
ncbi:hypothetical protein GALMADRAFT_148605 [Galerina marginata CBS 339.88]|uniref:Uncharacterized protein n=1 Tax=Galerina marginata (strain CBS 339.88) TaxID=685588 RepID=A0A067SFK9_GALM3|nr:hypothetical protein GALMADRAFT_148605 [Galerina marginata CBS 339.88]